MKNSSGDKCVSSQNHEHNHLCRIILQKDLEKVRIIVRDSKFFCKNCGRTAREEIHLCNPSRI